ncbi:DUF4097 family beta strand repeat-containing protein [Indiicoccus explosivorum]|uniref:DUF4097 family beta strand repeat-containing protein n=1 Tax=Indiicoccus explosivorum TaxID=1917864 RepID=UPI000B440B11|nr:DUF4097 family beta strand repeat-containing protein [Indiicoccus explosivorum]
MTEQHFLNELKARISGLPETEQQDILQDIREYFLDGKRDGKSEEAIAAELGSPASIGEELAASYKPAEQLASVAPAGEEEFDHVKADIANGALVLLPSDDGELHIDVQDKSYRHDLTVEVRERTLHVDLKEERKSWGLFRFGPSGSSPTVIVQLPSRTYGVISCETDNGRIEAEGAAAEMIHFKSDNGRILGRRLRAERMRAQSDNGRVELEDVTAAELLASSSNGRVDLSRISGGNIRVKSDNGRIDMTDIHASVMAKTDNGRIRLLTEDLERDISLETDNGSITVETAREPVNTVITARTDWGSIRVFGEKIRQQTFGNGEHSLHLKSDNGSIAVVKL